MNKIKEKLLKGCGGIADHDLIVKCGEEMETGCGMNWLCPTCQAKLQQHEETSKAKNEEFNKILEADILLFEQVSKCLDCEGCKKIINKRIQEIKQRIKEE